jgi:hypothetical protein
VPTPAGVGSTETALVLVLTTDGVPTAHAVEVVVIFRVITFWLLGGCARRRRRHQMTTLTSGSMLALAGRLAVSGPASKRDASQRGR